MDERYDLQQRIQELTAMAGVSFRSFKAMHHVSYTTLYQFVRNPSLARPRTLVSVRLVCEFLDAALNARLLPMPDKVGIEEKLDKMYAVWWGNGKKFPIMTAPVELKQESNELNNESIEH